MAEEVKAGVNFVEVTWTRALKVWWSLIWRGLLFGFLSGAVVGFILGLITGQMGASPGTTRTICQIASGVMSIPIGIAVTKIVLKKRFSDFRIALIKK